MSPYKNRKRLFFKTSLNKPEHVQTSKPRVNTIILFGKPDNWAKNQIPASKASKLSIWHPKTLLDTVQYAKMLYGGGGDLGKNRNPFCLGKFLYQEIP